MVLRLEDLIATRRARSGVTSCSGKDSGFIAGADVTRVRRDVGSRGAAGGAEARACA